MRCEICLHDADPHPTGPAGTGIGAYCRDCPKCQSEMANWSASSNRAGTASDLPLQQHL